MKWRWFDAAVGLAIGTGLLYACGHYYRQSFLSGFGLSAEQFQKSGDALVLSGFHAGMMGGVEYLLLGVAVLYAILVVLFLWMIAGRVHVLRVRWRAWRISRNKMSAKTRKRQRHLEAMPAFRTIERIAFIAPIMLAAFAALLLALIGAEKTGKSQARRAVERFDGRSRAVLHLENGRNVRAGPVIVCDEAACAYLMREGVLILPRDRVRSVSVAPIR
ncbi:hypothetical protein [Luteimonas huabeiensis]|uniref:hypothetical protein n=1 Tax=Luteimonas huabeiensis TaxID=1244513 RepID=UPI0004665892|nr:hypothetical protein [Luteimonas huabeiensis]